MTCLKCDLVVVGAGPAGSTAAAKAAEAGLDVVLLEKRQEIGSPVRCAEGVSRYGLRALLNPDSSWISAEVKGSRVHSPDGGNIVISEGSPVDEVGYILERKVFDRDLAALAASNGAEVMVKTSATGLIFKDGAPCGVSIRGSEGQSEVLCHLIVGADGVESKVGRLSGACSDIKPDEIEVCVQFLVRDRGLDPNYCEFYLGNEIAPGGYIWSLPKGDRIANVGICLLGSRSKAGLPLALLEKFLKRNMPDARVLDMVAGSIPISGTLHGSPSDRVMLVGDAGRQADPFTCGGILNAIRGGALAGNIASEAIFHEESGVSMVRDYGERWKDLAGRRISICRKLRMIFNGMNDGDLNGLIHALEGEDTSHADLEDLARMAFKVHPRILLRMGRRLV
jgi:digeranylgeranylglycerophospholipid reductase